MSASFLTLKEVAQAMGLSARALHMPAARARYSAAGLRFRRLHNGPRARLFVLPSDLHEYMTSRPVEGQE